ncbi:MAG TPA: hypothetical protein VMV45_03700 [Casimicrobiaceae bacterium]|nr:hypothetical protein [Casimicrobiaceae bacterium]
MQLTATALVLALGAIMTAPAYAQTSTSGGSNGPSPYAGTGNTVGPTGDPGATSNGHVTPGSGTLPMNRTGATTSPDPSTRSPSSDSWAVDYARTHQGRISRDAYLQEIGRRWDAYDSSARGLTPEQYHRMNNNPDDATAPPLSGSGVRPGDLGPANQKGK